MIQTVHGEPDRECDCRPTQIVSGLIDVVDHDDHRSLIRCRSRRAQSVLLLRTVVVKALGLDSVLRYRVDAGQMDDLRKTIATFIRHDVARFMVPMIRLVAEGRPVALERLAAASGVPVEEIESWLRAQPGTDWDEDGRLLGFGLTQRSTRHRYIVDGRVLYTFCAADTLIFTPILGRRAFVESSCPTTGQSIRLEVTPEAVRSVDPPTTVISHVNLCCGAHDIRG